MLRSIFLDTVEPWNRTSMLARAAALIQMVAVTSLFGMMVVAIFQVPQQQRKTAARELTAKKPPEDQNSAPVTHMSYNTKLVVTYMNILPLVD